MSEKGKNKYRQLLEKALKDLEEVCRSRGYGLKYDLEWDSGGCPTISLMINNPMNGGHVKLEVQNVPYKDEFDNIHVVRKEARGNIASYMRQRIVQIEALTEELSRKGLSMRDEAVAKEVALSLLSLLSFKLTWREVAIISRISLEYGFRLTFNYDKGYFICGEEVEASKEAVDRFLRDFNEVYGIDEEFIKDVQTSVKYEAKQYSDVIEKYFPYDVVALSILGERDLTNDEQKFIRKIMLKGGQDRRLKFAKKILYKLTQGIPEDRKEQLRSLMREYLEKVASKAEALTLFEEITDMHYKVIGVPHWKKCFTNRSNPGNAKIFAKIIGKVLGIKDIVYVDCDDNGYSQVVTTKDGYMLVLGIFSTRRCEITVFPKNRIFDAGSCTCLNASARWKMKKQHLELIRTFIEESKKYFETVLMRCQDKLAKDEVLLSYARMSAIAGDNLKIRLPQINVWVDYDPPPKEDFIKELRKDFDNALKNMEITIGKTRVRMTQVV